MSATVRTVFGMSSSAAHRLDCYGQVEVNFFTPAVSSGESAKSGLSRPDEWPNGGRTLGAGGYADYIRRFQERYDPLSGRDYASYSAISRKARHRRSCLSWNAVRRYRRQASPASSSGQPRGRSGHQGHAHMPAMRAATSSPTMATTRARSRRISVIATSRIRRAIPRWHRSGSRNFFEIDRIAAV